MPSYMMATSRNSAVTLRTSSWKNRSCWLQTIAYCLLTRNLLTIPGIGFVNAINVIVTTRNFTAFETARQYASYVGVAPHFRTSGTSVKWRPRPSARCDGQAKADVSMAATVVVQYDAELQSFYNRKLGGKQDSDTKRKALNAVKFKLVLRMFAIGKQNRKWEPLDSKSSNEKLAIS